MFETANTIFSVLINLFYGYCLQYFYGSFLDGRVRNRRANGAAVMALYALSRLALERIEMPEAWDYRLPIAKLAVGLCVLTVLAVCFYRAFHLITVFLVVAFQAVADISRYAVVILLGEVGDGLVGLWNRCMTDGIIKSEKTFWAAVKTSIIGQWLLAYLIMGLLLYLSLRKLVRDFREKEYQLDRTELLFILTPAAVALLLCMLLRIIMVTVEDSVPRILYDKYPVLTVVLPAILLLSLLSVLQGVKLFQEMIYRNREKSGRIILEKQVEGLQTHMEEMERIYSGIRGMKHDMRNTLSVIRRLSVCDGAKEKAELQAYLSELDGTFEGLEFRFRTGNTVVDTMLNMKYHEAVREVPALEMNADKLLIPQKLEIQSFDIGVIIGNALDNAIEACRRLREKEPEEKAFIRLGSLQKGKLLILKVENSFDGRQVKKRQSGLPATDKADKNVHGLGLANIKSTAEKYQGAMDFKIEGRVFILSVMMKNERRAEDGFWSDRQMGR